MDKIHDKASKILNDVRKKKVALGNKVDRNDTNREHQVKSDMFSTDLSSNSCCYCQKLFINPKFLLKHILRRHPEDLISLHRKCRKPGLNNNISDSSSLVDFLQKEFSDLRKELINFTQVSNKTKQDNASVLNETCELQENINSNKSHSSVSNKDMDAVDSGELKVMKEKILFMESNVECLCNKFEELNKVVKDDILSAQDIHNLLIANEEKIFRAQEEQLFELRNNLRKDLSTMIYKQLHENSMEWKAQFSVLNEEMQKLDYLVDSVRKQINSSVHLEAIEKKLEHQIFYFLNSASRTKNKTIKSRNSRRKSMSATKQILLQQDNQRLSKMDPLNSAKAFNSKQEMSTSYITSNDLSAMLAEKMSHFNIAPSTTKISCVEYIEKMKLLNSDKALLEQQFPNFSEIYKEINAYADDRVLSKLQNRKPRKLRFSEPLILTKKAHPKPTSRKNFPNQTYPLIDNESGKFSVNDIGGDGDCFRNFNEAQSDRYINQLESTPKTEFKAPRFNVNDPNSSVKCSKYSKDSDISIAAQSVTQDDYTITKVLENTEKINENSVLHARDTFTARSKICSKEILDNFQDGGDESSLESLSSWESEENL